MDSLEVEGYLAGGVDEEDEPEVEGESFPGGEHS